MRKNKNKIFMTIKSEEIFIKLKIFVYEKKQVFLKCFPSRKIPTSSDKRTSNTKSLKSCELACFKTFPRYHFCTNKDLIYIFKRIIKPALKASQLKILTLPWLTVSMFTGVGRAVHSSRIPNKWYSSVSITMYTEQNYAQIFSYFKSGFDYKIL